MAAELHYSRVRLIRLALLSMLGMALMLWVALGGVGDARNSHGPAAALARAIGPQGLVALGWIVAALAAVMALLYLRRALADPLAARADRDGLMIQSVFGRRTYTWDAVEAIALEWPARQPVLKLHLRGGPHRGTGLAVNGLVQNADEVEQWIGEARALRERETGAG
jgi:hypothetical protein